MCDFRGFVVPEMVKVRPVVVVSKTIIGREGLCTVVPLSTKAPNVVCDHHHLLDPESLPTPLRKRQAWAKCDMIATVSHQRLDRYKVRTRDGTRLYLKATAIPEDMKAIQRAMLCGLSLSHLTGHLDPADTEGVPATPASETTPSTV
jgi:mRNA interferase MazF